jgi:hypothetical protein
MATAFKYVQGDTGPQLRFTITEQDGSAASLTGATATLHVRAAGETTLLFSRQLVLLDQSNSPGVAVVQWAEGYLNQDPGSYEGELEIVKYNGVRETLYNKIKIKIREDFA